MTNATGINLAGAGDLAALLARGFAYPAPELHSDLASGEFGGHVLKSAGACGIALEPAALDALAVEAARVGYVGLQGEHTRLFARTVPCPPNASAYEPKDGLRTTRSVGEVASFYEAFGFQVSPGAHELADHISVELEFLGVLAIKEEYARQRSWRARATVCRDARTRFAAEYVTPWIGQFAARIEKQAGLVLYPTLASTAGQLVSLLERPG